MHRALLVSGWAFPASALDSLRQELALKGIESEGIDAKIGPVSKALSHLGNYDIIIGWSTGALMILDYLSRNAQELSSLVLIAATPQFCQSSDAPFGIPPRNLEAMQKGLLRNPERVLNSFYRNCAFPEPSLVTRPKLISHAELAPGLDFLAGYKLETTPSGRIMILHGEKDQIISIEGARALHERCETSQLTIYSNSGHDLPLRKPQEVAGAINEFLNKTTCNP